MASKNETARRETRHWADWFLAHMGWTALLAGGILCVVALILS